MKLFLCSAVLSLARGAENDHRWWAKKAVMKPAPFSTYKHIPKSKTDSKLDA